MASLSGQTLLWTYHAQPICIFLSGGLPLRPAIASHRHRCPSVTDVTDVRVELRSGSSSQPAMRLGGGVHFLRVSKHFNCIWPTMKRSSCRQGWGLGVGTGFGGNYFTYRNFSLNYRKLFQNFSFTYRNYLRMRTKVCEYRFLWFLPGSYCSTHSTHHLR